MNEREGYLLDWFAGHLNTAVNRVSVARERLGLFGMAAAFGAFLMLLTGAWISTPPVLHWGAVILFIVGAAMIVGLELLADAHANETLRDRLVCAVGGCLASFGTVAGFVVLLSAAHCGEFQAPMQQIRWWADDLSTMDEPHVPLVAVAMAWALLSMASFFWLVNRSDAPWRCYCCVGAGAIVGLSLIGAVPLEIAAAHLGLGAALAGFAALTLLAITCFLWWDRRIPGRDVALVVMSMLVGLAIGVVALGVSKDAATAVWISSVIAFLLGMAVLLKRPQAALALSREL